MPDINTHMLREGNRGALIGVHGAGGLLFFGKLARNIAPDISFHVLQGEGLSRSEAVPPFEDVHELADGYAGAVTDLDVSYPLFVCGRFSPIVLETGRRLLERGHKVEALIVFNVGIGKDDPDTRPEPEPRGTVDQSIRLIKSAPGVKGLRTKIREWYAPPRTRKPNPFRSMNERLKINYRPEKFFGRVVLIRSEKYAQFERMRKHVTMWTTMSNKLEVYVCPGSHGSMWNPPHIRRLGEIVSEVVASSEAGTTVSQRQA